MIRSIIWTVIFGTAAGILQSTVLDYIPFLKVKPDLVLCIVVFSAYVNGTMTGQVSGFFTGLLLDFFSAAPLGMHTFIKTVTGALAGIFKGALFLDLFFMPVILCTLATIVQALLRLVLNLVVGASVPIYSFTSSVFWIELGLNALCAPFLFLLLKNFKPIIAGRG